MSAEHKERTAGALLTGYPARIGDTKPNADLSGETASEAITAIPERVHATARRRVIQETS
ncbi:hypothetical protein [Candidatus Poriferisodalis sp.]|uniref:hypothetical protein n=1 Tax=Candidatus Poriferisodalis sp. TaxID=3101277 RepID=UPI003C6F534B